MFGKKMNTIFWSLVLPSIFFVFSATNFVTPKIFEHIDENRNKYFLASYLSPINFNQNSSTYSESLNWLILIILGILFTLISLNLCIRYIIMSKKYSNSKIRKFVFNYKKMESIGLCDYVLFNNNKNIKETKTITQQEIDNRQLNLNKFEINIPSILVILTIIFLVFSLIINLVIPFSMYQERVLPTHDEIKILGDNRQAVNDLIKNFVNNKLLYINLLGIFLCFSLAFFVIILGIVREIKKSNIEKLLIKLNVDIVRN